MSKNTLCPLIQNLLALMPDLASPDGFPLITSPDNGYKAGPTLRSLVTSSSIFAMLALNSLCLRITNPSFLHDIAGCALYGFKEPQLLGGLFNGRPYPTRTASQKSDFDKLNPGCLNGKIVNQLDYSCSCPISFNLVFMQDILPHNKVRVLCCFSIRFFCIFDLIFLFHIPLL